MTRRQHGLRRHGCWLEFRASCCFATVFVSDRAVEYICVVLTVSDCCSGLISQEWPFPGYCAKEKEHLGTCRLMVSDSILTHCHSQLNDLTAAIAKGDKGDSVQKLTDSLYKCGMTPVPGLYDGKQRRLPGRLEQGIVDVVEERKNKAEFLRVVSKQARDEYEQRRGKKVEWKPEGEDKE